MMRIFDIGGSGVKTLAISTQANLNNLPQNLIRHYPNPDWNNFPEWLSMEGLLDHSIIGISCAGFIANESIVSLFRVGNWINKPLCKEIKIISHPKTQIFLLNDAESHLMAHSDMYPKRCMSISLGTSLGFALSGERGEILRPSDGMNYDFGALTIATRATNSSVWWALGSHGLSELENSLGAIEGKCRFGNRLGSFLVNLSSIFRPETIVLSGGITANSWPIFSKNMQEEFDYQKPDWLISPIIAQSPHPRYAALIGIGKYVKEKILSGER